MNIMLFLKRLFRFNSFKNNKVLNLSFILRVTAIIAIVSLAYVSKSHAQGYLEGASFSYDLVPLHIKSATGDESFNCNNIKLTGSIPVYLAKDKSRFLLFGLNFESFGFPGVHPLFPVTNLYSISPVVGYSHQVNERFCLSAVLLPFLNSDLNVVNSSDLHFGGVVRGAYQVRTDFLARVTLGYREQFYGPQYIVFLGLDWKINNKWRLFGDLPNNATLCYTVNPKANAGIIYLAGNTSFHLTGQDHYIKYNYAQPGLFAEYYLTQNLAARGIIAYSYIRNLDIYNMNEKVPAVLDYIVLGSKPVVLNPEVSNGLAFKLSLSLRFPEHKK